MAKYQANNYKSDIITDQYKMLKKFELKPREHINLSKYCKKIGIEYCCSFFHEDDIKYV